jgi:hypothetical protein
MGAPLCQLGVGRLEQLFGWEISGGANWPDWPTPEASPHSYLAHCRDTDSQGTARTGLETK